MSTFSSIIQYILYVCHVMIFFFFSETNLLPKNEYFIWVNKFIIFLNLIECVLLYMTQCNQTMSHQFKCKLLITWFQKTHKKCLNRWVYLSFYLIFLINYLFHVDFSIKELRRYHDIFKVIIMMECFWRTKKLYS